MPGAFDGHTKQTTLNDPVLGPQMREKARESRKRNPKAKAKSMRNGAKLMRVDVPGMMPSRGSREEAQLKRMMQNDRAIARMTAATDLIADFNEKLLRRGLALLDKELLDEPEVQVLREATKMSMRLLDKQVPDLLSDSPRQGDGGKLVQIVVGAAITRLAPKPDTIEIPTMNGNVTDAPQGPGTSGEVKND